MQFSEPALTIGELAAAAEVGVETIRFYQRRGLLAQPAKPYGSIRRYGREEVARVAFIKAAQRLGFSLEQVASLLTLDDGAHCDQARRLAEQKLAEVRAKLSDLRRMEAALGAAVRACAGTQGTVHCPLIATLRQQPRAPRRALRARD